MQELYIEACELFIQDVLMQYRYIKKRLSNNNLQISHLEIIQTFS